MSIDKTRLNFLGKKALGHRGPFASALAATSIAAMILAACGGGDDGADGPTDGSPQSAEVTIKRDAYGVPHMISDSVLGLFYGAGYAIAEDRLFQMEMTRRAAIGSVSEVLGSDYIEYDKAVRGNYDLASLRRQYETLSADDKAVLDGYVMGYNARVDEVKKNRTELLPKEFADYGFDPTAMTLDELLSIFVHDMAIRFSGYNGEVDNLYLLSQLKAQHGSAKGTELFEQLMFEHDSRAQTTISAKDQIDAAPPTFRSQGRLDAADAKLAANKVVANRLAKLEPISKEAFSSIRNLRGLYFGPDNMDQPPRASLGWVTGRDRTVGAKAVLTDGAQMGNTAPGIVWSFGLHGAGFNTVGITQVGVPAVLFGTNGDVAWGGTAGMGDVVDVYQEKLNPADPHQYLYQGSYRPMSKRTEVIKVKGEADVVADVYSTVHGIVMSFDAANGTAYSVKRAWEGKELESLFGWLHSTRAKNYEEWMAQIARWGLSINWLYADKEGNIGYVYTGQYPDRPSTQDFRLPAVGTGEMEWKGLRPLSTNPQVYNPDIGYLASWNNLSQPNYNSSDSIYWGQIDHVVDIQSLLAAKPKHTSDDVWDIVRGVSYIDGNARFFKPMLLEALRLAPANTDLLTAAAILEAWNLDVVDSPTAAQNTVGHTLLKEWLSRAQTRLVSVSIPAEVRGQFVRSSPSFVAHGTLMLLNALQGDEAGVKQTHDLLEGATADQFMRETMLEAVAALKAQYGADSSSWRSAAGKHSFSRQNFARVPIASPDAETVRLDSASMNRGTFNYHVTFGDTTTLCDVMPPGQSAFRSASGSTESPNYQDQFEVYAEFDCKSQALTVEDVNRTAKSTRVLMLTAPGN